MTAYERRTMGFRVEGLSKNRSINTTRTAPSYGWSSEKTENRIYPCRMEPLFRKIDCLSLPVPDLDEALAFYQKALGHELLWRDETSVGLRLPDCDAELVLHREARPAEVDFLVESVPLAVRCLVEKGAELVAGPFEIRIGLCAVLRDPWKNPITILDTSKGLLAVDETKRVRGKESCLVDEKPACALGRQPPDSGEPLARSSADQGR